MKNLIKKIKENLTPDLLHKKYNTHDPKNPLKGHCYIASEALFYLLGDNQFKPKVATYEAVRGRGSHWWLENKKTGKIIDITAKQFNKDFVKELYKKGRFCGFLTNKPSRKAKILMDRVKKFK